MSKMTSEQLTDLIKNVVADELKNVQGTQYKYAGDLNQPPNPAKDPATEPSTKEPTGEQLEPGIRLARAAKLMILAKNDPERALFFAKGGVAGTSKGMYPNDVELHNTFKALSAGTPSDGGYLVPEQYADEIIPLLRAKAVVRKMGARPIPMSGGNLNLPKVLGGATAYYIGENMDAKASQPRLGNLRLSGKKLVTLVPISNDLIRTSSYEADRMIRDDMIATMALKEDWSALYGTGTDFVPRGLANTSGIITDNLGDLPNSDNMADMIGELISRDIPMNAPGWIFNGRTWNVLYNLKTGTGQYLHRDEMNQGKFLGYPFALSNQITNGEDANRVSDVFFGDWNEFIIGEEMGLEIMASQEATYINEGGQMTSAFSQDQTVIKVTSKHDFGARHGQAFYVRKGVHTKA